MADGELLFLSASTPPARGEAFLHPEGAASGAALRPAAILGLPLDRTTSYRSGTAGGPDGIRAASWSLETYSPALGGDLADLVLYDFGDLAMDGQPDLQGELSLIEQAVGELCRRGLFPVLIGGEHLVTLPAYRAVARAPGGEWASGGEWAGPAGGKPGRADPGGRPPAVFHYDAHADLRDDYEGLRLSHATVMRRVAEVAGGLNIYQFGVRSGDRKEMLWGADNINRVPGPLVAATRTALQAVSGRGLYVSLDIDVLDPAQAPGTGNPEPGGPSADEIFESVAAIGAAASLGAAGGGIDLLGFDLVEVSPPLDPSGRTPVVAAKIIRELLIARGA